MASSRWAPKATSSAGPSSSAVLVEAPCAAPTSTTSAAPQGSRPHSNQQRCLPPSSQGRRHQSTTPTSTHGQPPAAKLPAKDADSAVAPKKNTWDIYKYKPELDVEISFNEDAKARNRPSRLGNGPKHDTKGLTGAAASRWAPKHVVEQALKLQQEEAKEENLTSLSLAPPSAAQIPSELQSTTASDGRHDLTAPTTDIGNSATTPAQEYELPPAATSPQGRLDSLLTTFKTVNEERISSSPEAALPSLLSRMAIPDNKPPEQEDPWLIKSFSQPETSRSATPGGGCTINWADEDDDDEEDLEALIGREWGVASLAKVEEKEQAEQVKRSTNRAPEPNRGVSIKGQATKATAPAALHSPNKGLELLPSQGSELTPSQSPSKDQVASRQRVRPQVATQSDAFARLSRGFLGSGPAAPAPGGGARTRGKRAGKELLKESGS